MEIRVNTDNHITGSENMVATYTELIKNKLRRFDEYITTVEVFFADENNAKSSLNDKRCTIEVRPRNRNNEAVTHNADTLQHAFNGAIDKMRSVLDTQIGKLQNK